MDKIHSRAKIRLEGQRDAVSLIALLHNSPDRFLLENEEGTLSVSATSLLGVVYAMTEWPNQMFLVNSTHDGSLPNGIDVFRPTGSKY